MEDILSALLMISSLLVFTWIMRLLNWVWWTPKKLEKQLREQGFRGPPYRLLYGSLKENPTLMKEACSTPMNLNHKILPRVNPLLYKIVKEYGKMSMIWFGTSPRVNIMDPELVKEVLSNKSGHFEKLKQHPFVKLLATGVATYNGEKWVNHRRLLSPAFHQEKLKRMLPAFSTSCSEMVKKWEMLIGSKESYELDVWPELQNLTADVISRAAFGSSYNEGKRIFQLQSEQTLLVSKAIRTIYIPGFRFFPTKENIRRKEIEREVRALFRGMIENREKAMKTNDSSNDDLLSLLLESNNEVHENQKRSKDIRLTIEDIIEECKLFYFAGYETTAVLLTWTMVALSMHPNWQEHAREEVLQVFGKHSPDNEGLNRLKIVSMVLYEALRLYSGVVLVRQANKRVKLGNFSFAPGVQLALPMLLIQRDPELWGDDADEFKPERFSGGLSNASKHQMAFFPFGGGPRICLGQNFALMEAKIALAMILQRFSFELSPSYVHAPRTVITIQPQHGAQIILHRI
ncbi:hypothetical protein MRB53_015689 [Persea americana]|uniref:Uncharacterized protein n=1 Tax=Persea americana TaxID=3435 RepID=A0ACC2M022_PERAE|nr:hypothetical protein MRB53_015689 [Persea americana]